MNSRHYPCPPPFVVPRNSKMNELPFAFYEYVCCRLSDEGLSEAEKLPGRFGEVARLTYRSNYSFVGETEDGTEELRIDNAYLRQICSGERLTTEEEFRAVPTNAVRDVTFCLLHAEGGILSRILVQHFSTAKFYNFGLRAQSITEAWMDFACSLKRLGFILLLNKLKDNALRLFKRLVDGRKLTELQICDGAYDDDMLDIMKSILCQDQLKQVKIANYINETWESSAVQDILQFWSDNSDKLRGKKMVLDKEVNCQNGASQLLQFLASRNPEPHQLRLDRCSKEELDFIDKYYCHHHTLFVKPSCVYKHEEGEGDNRRKLYISFECATDEELQARRPERPASLSGHDDLDLLQAAISIHILFA
uniref:Sister chromatid cohesion protein DCC1 n=1 Tax=Steinernema glaseri TaxID=37863 RepID=A0A1I7ZTC0_9BILA